MRAIRWIPVQFDETTPAHPSRCADSWDASIGRGTLAGHDRARDRRVAGAGDHAARDRRAPAPSEAPPPIRTIAPTWSPVSWSILVLQIGAPRILSPWSVASLVPRPPARGDFCPGTALV